MVNTNITELEFAKKILEQLFAKVIAGGFNRIQMHTYTDQNGKPIYYKARLKNADGQKQIRPFYYNQQANKWEMKEPPFIANQKPLYLLHTLAQSQSVWIFEGEQKADLMQSLGYCATTTGGARSITAHNLTPLQGKQCYFLWRDNDQSGKEWLATMATAIKELNQNREFTLLAVDVDSLGLPEKGDIMDYLDGLPLHEQQNKIANLPYIDDVALSSLIAEHSTPITARPPARATTTARTDDKSNIQWQTPKPLDMQEHREIPYPLHAFSDELKAVIERIAYLSQTPVALVGHSVLGALSAIAQRQVNANFLNGGIMPCSLFLLAEFPSGQGKSQVNNLVNRGIIEWEQANYLDFENELAQYERLPPKDKASQSPPKNTAYIVGDATIEAVTDKFVLDGQKNVLWITDECGQFFNGYSLKGDTAASNLGGLLQAYDKGTFAKLRSGRGKMAHIKTHAYDCRLTLNLLGQRVVIEPALNNPLLVNQGFLPRVLLTCPKPKQGYREFNTPERLNLNYNDCWELNEFYAKQKRLLAPEPNQRQTLWLDGAGVQALADYMQEVEILQQPNKAYCDIVAFASRMGENTARIACLFAFWNGDSNVTAHHINQARLLVDYSIKELLTYHDISDSGQSLPQKANDWILKRAKRTGRDWLYWSEVLSNINPKELRKADRLQEILQHLKEYDRVILETQEGKGIIKINPQLLK